MWSRQYAAGIWNPHSTDCGCMHTCVLKTLVNASELQLTMSSYVYRAYNYSYVCTYILLRVAVLNKTE